jgi:peptidoglycan/xylan/chitin deacetylase (PgdA/CDA1 family)
VVVIVSEAMIRPLRRAFAVGLRASLAPLLCRELFQRRAATIVAYHAPSPEAFDAHLTVLTRLYRVIALADYVIARQEGREATLPAKALIITLDDGHRSNYRLRTVLRKHDVPVTMFVCTGVVGTGRGFWFLHPAAARRVQELKGVSDAERRHVLRGLGFDESTNCGDPQALSESELESLRECVDLQSHSVSHPILPQCSTGRAAFEIGQSKQDLESRCGGAVYAFAYPNGSYTEREVELVRGAGYRCALTLDPGSNSARTPLLKLRRICVPDDAGVHELVVRVSGLWGVLKKVAEMAQIKSRAILRGIRCGAH